MSQRFESKEDYEKWKAKKLRKGLEKEQDMKEKETRLLSSSTDIKIGIENTEEDESSKPQKKERNATIEPKEIVGCIIFSFFLSIIMVDVDEYATTLQNIMLLALNFIPIFLAIYAFLYFTKISQKKEEKKYEKKEEEREINRKNNKIKRQIKEKKRQEEEEKFRSKIESITIKHVKTLAIKRKQLIYKDSYGNEFYDKWLDELNYFLNKMVYNDCDSKYLENRDDHIQLTDFIVNQYSNEQDLEQDNYSPSPNMSPLEYEHYCADILNRADWNATTTKASGDQGIDIIAEKNDLRIVIQCKLYNSASVGNKAIQEIVAGKQYERADYAVVVSNAKFTKSAHALARTTDTLLLHHDQLSDLEDFLFRELNEI